MMHRPRPGWVWAIAIWHFGGAALLILLPVLVCPGAECRRPDVNHSQGRQDDHGKLWSTIASMTRGLVTLLRLLSAWRLRL